MLTSYQALYNLAAYTRYKQCFHREACSVPGSVISMKNHVGQQISAINTCSYNYLGLSIKNFDEVSIKESFKQYGLGTFINRSVQDLTILRKLEKQMA